MIRFLIFLLCTSPIAIQAGTITSGGALNLRYAENPWWLENTTQVKYCIEADERYFDYTQDELSTLVQSSIKEWTDLFASAEDDYYGSGDLIPFGQLRVGTQKFLEVSCEDNPELRFQFGVATDDQKKEFGNIKDFLGAAVQTNYNRVKLESRGYIYISALDGDLGPESEVIDKAAWSKETCNGCLLKLAVRHELGHIFGLRDNRSGDLMDERLLDRYTQKKFTSQIKQIPTEKFNSNFSPLTLNQTAESRTYEGCDYDRFLTGDLKFWEKPEEYPCERMEINFDDESKEIRIYAAKDHQAEYELIGRVMDFNHWSTNFTYLATVDLPSEQLVFEAFPDRNLSGEGIKHSTQTSAIYETSSGRRKPISLKFNRRNELDVIEATGLSESGLEFGLITIDRMLN